MQQNGKAQISPQQQKSPYIDYIANNLSSLHGSRPLIQE